VIDYLLGTKMVASFVSYVYHREDDESTPEENWVSWQLFENRFGARKVKIKNGGPTFYRRVVPANKIPGFVSQRVLMINNRVSMWKNNLINDVEELLQILSHECPPDGLEKKPKTAVTHSDDNVVTVDFTNK